MIDSAKDVLERAAKKGLMKGTKRGKKDAKIKSEPLLWDKQQLDEMPKQLENVSTNVTDEKEPNVSLDSKDGQRKAAEKKLLKPFQF